MPHDLLLLLRPSLLGKPPDWPSGAVHPEDLLAQARIHGVDGLLYWHAAGRCAWPPAVMEPLRAAALGRAVWESRHQQVLSKVVEALDRMGARPLLLKGTALAYTEYPEPSLRTRADTDVFITAQTREAACRCLSDLGFVRQAQVGGEHVMSQSSYVLRAADHTEHAIDLHWQASNEPTVAKLFNHAELLAASVPCERLAPQARIPSRALSLLFACVHRAKHRHGDYQVHGQAIAEPDRLIWLYDIHLLGQSLQPNDWLQVVSLAREKGVCGVILEGLERARDAWGTPLPAEALAAMRVAGTHEAGTRYFASGPLGRAWMDWRALPRAERWPWLRETLVPPAEELRSRHPGSQAPLFWLYARRAILGLTKRLMAHRVTPRAAGRGVLPLHRGRMTHREPQQVTIARDELFKDRRPPLDDVR